MVVNVAVAVPIVKMSSSGVANVNKTALIVAGLVAGEIPRTVAKSPVASRAVALVFVNVIPVEVQLSFPPPTPTEPMIESAKADGAITMAIAIARNPSVNRFMCFSYQVP